MACALTQSLNLDCRDSFGGVKRVLLIELDNVTSFTVVANVVTVVTKAVGKFFRQYNLIAFTGDGKSDNTHNRKEGTSEYKHSVMFPINKITTSVSTEIGLLAQNRLYIILEDNNGAYWLYGKDFGMMLETSAANLGVELKDRNGFNLTFGSSEKALPIEVSSSIITGLLS